MYKFFFLFLLLAAAISQPLTSSAQNNKLESTGNVGIGTTTPVVKLSIYGPADDSAAISLQSGSNSRFYIQQGGALLKIGGVTPGTGVINVLNTGNVGIGTGIPSAPLHVVTSAGAAGITAQSTAGYSLNGGAFLRLYNSGTPTAVNQRLGGLLIGTNPTGTTVRTGAQIEAYSEDAWTDGSSQPTFLRFLTTQKDAILPAERMRITADGNIQVQQKTQFGFGLSDRFTYDGQPQANYGLQWTTDSWYTGAPTLWTSAYGGMKFFTQGVSRIAINVDGNVGIGTTTPGAYKLAVEGTIGARRVKVQQGTWADFVFEPEYELSSLAELEDYIRANRHLPDVPSAVEVAREGLDLGEMNKNLLQKIEELTLYMISQNKDLEAKQARIAALEQAIQSLSDKVLNLEKALKQ